MLPTIQVGPLAIQLPGLLLLLGFWLGLSLAEKHAHRHGVTPNQVYTITFTALITAVIVARLLYVARHLPTFTQNPGGILSLNLDLLDPWGAILGAGMVIIFLIHRYKLTPWSLADALAPVLAVLMVTYHMSNLASGDGYGAPSELPWAIFLLGERRHPAQIYELIAALTVLFIFWPGSPRNRFTPPGRYALLVLAATASSRLFFEAFRGDSTITNGGLRSAQLIAWLIMALAFWLIARQARRASVSNSSQPPSNEGASGQ
jgi:prolipoprotein diacylglyceryltransferase